MADTDDSYYPTESSISMPKVTTHVRSSNDLDVVTVKKCGKCEKSCVMCVLHKAQCQIQTAVEEMGKAEQSAAFCYCQAHVPRHSACIEHT